MLDTHQSPIKFEFDNYPRAFWIHVNSDEQVCVYTTGLAMLESGNFKVAGRIERDDSKVICRGHKVRVKDFMETEYDWKVLSYNEYDNDPEDNQISIQVILETPRAIIHKAHLSS